ncbi:MAG: YraN family protein [Bacteroidales bacterium]|nr:YraN family protein [Bacteroidales bacterium]
MAQHNETGKKGEEIAREMLLKKGYSILHTNWVIGKLELDIVATHENTLIIVEVKTRDRMDFASPSDMISNGKIRNIVNATHEYILKFDINMDVRFDVVSVVKNGDNYIPEHIEDAFYPPRF